ncbi:MAG: Gfo/Idh/MocA family oxidoreductase [Burkholderiaceae bacterium]
MAKPSDIEPVRVGVCGLGRAFVLSMPGFEGDRRIRLVAACAPRAESRHAFEQRYAPARTYAEMAALCDDPDVEVVYVATPHQFHAEHVILAAQAGKHVVVEKPIAVNIADAVRMIDAVERAGVTMIVGPSHSLDEPVRVVADMLASGDFGQLRMIHSLNYTDFMYRPRRPEELVTRLGGGVVFSQGAHQIDVARRLTMRPALSVQAQTGSWDPQRPSEGAYQALLRFEDGAIASLTYSGYGHFDSDEWMDWVGELGHAKSPDTYGHVRRQLAQAKSPEDEIRLKSERTFGATRGAPRPTFHEHFGPVIASADHADLRLSPDGVWIYGDDHRSFRPAAKMTIPRIGLNDAIVDALRHGRAPIQDGRWGLATLEICHAIVDAAASGQTVTLVHQGAAAARPPRGNES